MLLDARPLPASAPAALHAARDYLAAAPLPLLAAILLLALPLRLLLLGESLWLDELWSIRIVLDRSDPLYLLARDIHPPLYSLFLFAWVALFGDTELSIRLPSLLFGLLAIVLSWRIASRYIGRQAALLACLLLALSPVQILYAQEARAYAGLQFLLLCALLAYLELQDDPARQPWVAVYACSLLAACLTSFLLGVYLLGFSVLALGARPALRSRILILNGLVAVPLVAWALVAHFYAADLLRAAASYLRPFTPYEAWMLLFNWFPMGNAVWSVWPYADGWAPLEQPALLVMQVLLAALFVRGLILVGREASRAVPLLAALFLLPLSLLALSVTPLERLYIERSVFVALPLYFMVLARGALGFRRPTLTAAAVAVLLGMSLASVAAFVARPDDWTVYKPRPDWRAATAYLERELAAQAQTSPVFLVSLADELLYYARRYDHPERQQPTVYRHSGTTTTESWLDLRYVDQRINPCALSLDEEQDAFYLVHNRHWSAGFQAVLDHALHDAACQLSDQQAYKSLDIYRFAVRRPR